MHSSSLIEYIKAKQALHSASTKVDEKAYRGVGIPKEYGPHLPPKPKELSVSTLLESANEVQDPKLFKSASEGKLRSSASPERTGQAPAIALKQPGPMFHALKARQQAASGFGIHGSSIQGSRKLVGITGRPLAAMMVALDAEYKTDDLVVMQNSRFAPGEKPLRPLGESSSVEHLHSAAAYQQSGEVSEAHSIRKVSRVLPLKGTRPSHHSPIRSTILPDFAFLGNASGGQQQIGTLASQVASSSYPSDGPSRSTFVGGLEGARISIPSQLPGQPFSTTNVELAQEKEKTSPREEPRRVSAREVSKERMSVHPSHHPPRKRDESRHTSSSIALAQPPTDFGLHGSSVAGIPVHHYNVPRRSLNASRSRSPTTSQKSSRSSSPLEIGECRSPEPRFLVYPKAPQAPFAYTPRAPQALRYSELGLQGVAASSFNINPLPAIQVISHHVPSLTLPSLTDKDSKISGTLSARPVLQPENEGPGGPAEFAAMGLGSQTERRRLRPLGPTTAKVREPPGQVQKPITLEFNVPSVPSVKLGEKAEASSTVSPRRTKKSPNEEGVEREPPTHLTAAPLMSPPSRESTSRGGLEVAASLVNRIREGIIRRCGNVDAGMAALRETHAKNRLSRPRPGREGLKLSNPDVEPVIPMPTMQKYLVEMGTSPADALLFLQAVAGKKRRGGSGSTDLSFQEVAAALVPGILPQTSLDWARRSLLLEPGLNSERNINLGNIFGVSNRDARTILFSP